MHSVLYVNYFSTKLEETNKMAKRGICIYREQFKHKQILHITHNILCCNHQRKKDKLKAGSDWWMRNMKES